MVKKIFFGIGLTVCFFLMAGTVWLGFYAKQKGIFYLKTGGDPGETVSLFYDAVLARDYDTAYSYLLDYRSLGFDEENALGTEDLPAGCWELFRNALLDSYRYELEGEPEIEERTARQKVKFTCFSTELFRQEMNDCYYQTLNDRVQTSPKHEIFDDDGNYRVNILEEVYETALKEALKDSGKYLRSTEYTVELRYQNKEWKILVSDEMTEGFMGNRR